MSDPIIVQYRRGGIVESTHVVHAIAVDATGATIAAYGDVNRNTCLRSMAKPFQALSIVEHDADIALGFTDEERAIACGSINAEEFQVAAVRGILAKAGLDEDALQCGADYPSHRDSMLKLVRNGEQKKSIYHNCAAKHAGMLAVCRHCGWDTASYLDPGHPLQQEVLATIARYICADSATIPVVTDGCGTPTHFLPLDRIAVAYGRLARMAAIGRGPAARLMASALSHPEMIAGTKRIDSDIIRLSRGRVFAKVGAESGYAAFHVERGEALALKVEDGGNRAVAPALTTLMRKIGWINDAGFDALFAHWRSPLKNSQGRDVGDVVVIS